MGKAWVRTSIAKATLYDVMAVSFLFVGNERERERERQRQTDRQTDRQGQTDRQRDRQTETGERGWGGVGGWEAVRQTQR